MKIVDLIKRDMVVPALVATDKRGILEELAMYMAGNLGVRAALNLDGGGSATLVAKDAENAFHVINSPMDGYMQPARGGSRELYSAIVFTQL